MKISSDSLFMSRTVPTKAAHDNQHAGMSNKAPSPQKVTVNETPAFTIDDGVLHFKVSAADPELSQRIAALEDNNKIFKLGLKDVMDTYFKWSEDSLAYDMKKMSFVAKQVGLQEDEIIGFGGAADDLMRQGLERTGVLRPEMPELLKQAGFARGGSDDEGNSSTGVFSIAKQSSDATASRDVATVYFDRNVALADDSMEIVDLESGGGMAQGVIDAIHSGSLSSSVSTIPQDGKHRYAITNGKHGSDAKVAAVFLAKNGDTESIQRSVSVYKAFNSWNKAVTGTGII